MQNASDGSEFQAALNSHPKGRGFRPAFHALWHLETLKIVNNLKEFHSPVWDSISNQVGSKRAARIVVMDTPIDYNHPCLIGGINLALMRDFSVFNDGAFPIGTSKLDSDQLRARRELAGLESDGWKDTEQARIVAEEVADREDDPRRSRLARQVAGAHGTAVCGLIAARPTEVRFGQSSYLGEEVVESKITTVTLPYAGLNPFSEVIPVTLSAAPFPDMVLGALEYVAAINPDVVVIAAAWADSMDRRTIDEKKLSSAPLQQNEFGEHEIPSGKKKFDYELWKAVEKEIIKISKNGTIVLCAAGNVDSRELAFPASLCAKKGNEIWAVTACDEDGERLSYAPGVDPKKRMIKTLSTQLPRNDRVETVIDPWQVKIPELSQEDDGYKTVSARDLVTLDPLGKQGYNPTEFPETKDQRGVFLEIGSIFSRFSGTSAATAVAGGLASLALQSDGLTSAGEFDSNSLFDFEQALSLWGNRDCE